MDLNNGLNLDGLPDTVATGDYRYAENVVLDNTFKLPTNENGLTSFLKGGEVTFDDIAGIISYDKGIIIFHKILTDNYITQFDTNTETIIKQINCGTYIDFNKTQPVRGTYTYSQNGSLIIIFGCGVDGNWEDKIINFNDYIYTNGVYTLTSIDFYKTDLNPNVVFPKINSTIIKGSLLAGSYQIAVAYKIGNEYTNYSLLSLPEYIYNGDMNFNGDEGSAPNTITNCGINYNFEHLDINYMFYKIAIIYNDGTNFKVYNSKDISTNIDSYKLNNIDVLNISSLDDTLINSIFYSNSESFNVMNNRLYRANIKTNTINQFDIIAQNIANNLSLKLVTTTLNLNTPANPNYINPKDIYSKQLIKFQSNEVYALYFTIGDKKGNVIGSYPINTDTISGGLSKVSSSNNNFTCKVTYSSDGLNYIFTLNRITTIDIVISYLETITHLMNDNTTTVHTRNSSVTILANTLTTIQLIVPYNVEGSSRNGSYVVTILNITPTTDSLSTILDYAYLIPNENTDIIEDNNVKYTINNIEVELPSNINVLLGDLYNNIGFWCIHRATRNNSNSKIYTQGIATAGSLQSINAAEDAFPKPFVWIANPFNNWLTSDYNKKFSYFENGNFKPDKYPIRFYSFEDLFNRNSNFPINTKIETISRYYPELVDSANKDTNASIYEIGKVINIAYINRTNNTEKKYTANSNIQEQKLLSPNNISISNFYQESTRQLKLEENSTNFTIAKNGVVNTDNAKRLFRCNIYNSNTDYYANIYNENLVLCSKLNRIIDTTIVANGDTFYSDFYIRFKRLSVNNQPNNNTDIPVFESKYISDLDTTLTTSEPVYKLEFNIRFLVESKYNIHARYWKGDYPEIDNPINTVEQVGYNKVYNLQNDENVVSAVDIINDLDRQKISNVYSSRIIKSVTSNVESNQLGFRKYLALDYYDMPYNRRAIKALYSTYKNMYIQQELALSIASVKDIISYQDGATYVGTGQLFDRQPTEVFPTGYGYVGCESYYNTGICDLGYWVIDAVQSQIFLITDESATILTEGKCKRWFKDKLRGVNPFINQGSYITYDRQLKRFLLTVTNPDASKSFTISYVPEIKNWLSFHFYTPMYGTYTRNDTYYLINIDTSKFTIFKYVDSIKSQIKTSSILNPLRRNITTIQDMIISIYHNDYSSINKFYEAISWDTSFVINNTDIYDKTFTKLNITSDSQSTGNIDLNINKEWFEADSGVYKDNVWFFNKIYDIVKDNKINIFNPSATDIYDTFNINEDNLNQSLEWFDISQFISTFVAVSFVFDNLYYTSKGERKGLTATLINPTEEAFQPTFSLKDIDFNYKQNNR